MYVHWCTWHCQLSDQSSKAEKSQHLIPVTRSNIWCVKITVMAKWVTSILTITQDIRSNFEEQSYYLYQTKKFKRLSITDTRQATCIGRDEELYHPVPGECRLPDQHPGYKLPASTGPAVNTTQGDGVQYKPSLSGRMDITILRSHVRFRVISNIQLYMFTHYLVSCVQKMHYQKLHDFMDFNNL